MTLYNVDAVDYWFREDLKKFLEDPWGLKTTLVKLDDETLTDGRHTMDKLRSWLMAESIKQHVAREEWFLLEVEKGVKAAEEGHLASHNDIKAKWEAKFAAQRD